MRMLSYAQNHEDVLLDRVFPRGVPGFYIDVGAYDPIQDSVTKHFCDLGWRGINIEPSTGGYERLTEARERDVNLNVGLSHTEGSLTLYESVPDSGRSTFSAEIAAWHEEIGFKFKARSVPVTTLARVCEDHVHQTIDFVSIDVEGHEREVLEGGDWRRWRPRLVMVEATQPGTKIPTHDQWEDLLLEADYVFVNFDGLNRYYLREEDADLAPAFSSPVNVLDDYEPYGYWKQIGDLREALASGERNLAAARAVNESLRAENRVHWEELDLLESRYEKLESVLAQLRAQYESIEGALRRTAVSEQDVQRDIMDARAQAESLLADVGPTGLAVAKRLGRLSRQLPGPARALKGPVRLALALKRKISPAPD